MNRAWWAWAMVLAAVILGLVWHLAGSLFPFAAYYGGAKLRVKRFEFECRSLVDRLTAMQEVLEERSE
jgi:hypothetical protein